MERENPAEKLLQASGARLAKPQQKPQVKSPEELMKDHLAQMDQVVRALTDDVKDAVTLAAQAHDRGEWMIANLKKYCRETLPQQMVQAIDEVAKQGVCDSLRPLDERIQNAAQAVAALERRTANIGWHWFRDVALIGIFSGLVMTALARWLFW